MTDVLQPNLMSEMGFFFAVLGIALASLLPGIGSAIGVGKAGQAAEVLIHRIEQMNRDMQIPATIAELRREDIPKLARQADKEANPLYPVPVLWNAKELEEIYRMVLPGSA